MTEGTQSLRRASAVFLGLIVATAWPASAREPELVAAVEAFRAARDAGDLDLARTFLSDDPRVWYEAREGPGRPWTLGAGRWAAWDDHFRGRSEPGPWTVEGDTVYSIAEETNDYFRLLEREDTPRYRISYFFDGRGKIEGTMISAADPDGASEPRRDRFREFEAWARANHPEEWEYLRPGGELDPTGDRAPRTRRLLLAWRREVGLPSLDQERLPSSSP